MKSTDHEREERWDPHFLNVALPGFSITISLVFALKTHAVIWFHFKGALVPMAYCCKVSMYVVLDEVQNESSYCCGALLECLSLSKSLAKPFELMISQFIWKQSFPGQPSVQIQFTGSYHRVVMGMSVWSVWPLLFRTHASHNSLERQMEKLFVWKK